MRRFNLWQNFYLLSLGLAFLFQIFLDSLEPILQKIPEPAIWMVIPFTSILLLQVIIGWMFLPFVITDYDKPAPFRRLVRNCFLTIICVFLSGSIWPDQILGVVATPLAGFSIGIALLFLPVAICILPWACFGRWKLLVIGSLAAIMVNVAPKLAHQYFAPEIISQITAGDFTSKKDIAFPVAVLKAPNCWYECESIVSSGQVEALLIDGDPNFSLETLPSDGQMITVTKEWLDLADLNISVGIFSPMMKAAFEGLARYQVTQTDLATGRKTLVFQRTRFIEKAPTIPIVIWPGGTENPNVTGSFGDFYFTIMRGTEQHGFIDIKDALEAVGFKFE